MERGRILEEVDRFKLNFRHYCCRFGKVRGREHGRAPPNVNLTTDARILRARTTRSRAWTLFDERFFAGKCGTE